MAAIPPGIEKNDRIFNCVLYTEGTWEDFYTVAGFIEIGLNIGFKSQVDDVDSRYWSFEFQGIELTLHYHEMIRDVELFCDRKPDTNQVVLLEMAMLIYGHLYGRAD